MQAKDKNIHQARIELATSAVWRPRHNQLDHRCLIFVKKLTYIYTVTYYSQCIHTIHIITLKSNTLDWTIKNTKRAHHSLYFLVGSSKKVNKSQCSITDPKTRPFPHTMPLRGSDIAKGNGCIPSTDWQTKAKNSRPQCIKYIPPKTTSSIWLSHLIEICILPFSAVGRPRQCMSSLPKYAGNSQAGCKQPYMHAKATHLFVGRWQIICTIIRNIHPKN